MIRRALALAFVTAFGLAVAVWNIASRADPPPMPIGTCVSISADDWLESVTCDGPHTHVFTTWLAGLHHLRGSHNPCPSHAEVPRFLGDGVACYTPAAASR